VAGLGCPCVLGGHEGVQLWARAAILLTKEHLPHLAMVGREVREVYDVTGFPVARNSVRLEVVEADKGPTYLVTSSWRVIIMGRDLPGKVRY